MTARDREDLSPYYLVGFVVFYVWLAWPREEPPADPPPLDPIHFTVLDGTDEQSCITDHR